MQGHTQTTGSKTRSHTRHSTLNIENKDPNFDYCFRRRKEIEDGGGADIFGWEPIGPANSNGESFQAFPGQKRTKGTGQMVYIDTVACKRPKEVSRFFKSQEDEKYNAQIQHVRTASTRTREALRELDPDSVVEEKATFKGPGMTQRKGPTEEGE